MWKTIKAQIPNTITCLNLLSGCVAIILAFSSTETFGALKGYQLAFIFIGAAAIFDFCDGAMARLLKAYSNVGKELDSLADLVSFGVAPAMLVFNTMNYFNGECWVSYFALLIAALGGVRLARFNVDTRQTTTFIGLPIPANAIFWIGFVAWNHAHGYAGNWATPIIIVVMSLMMVSGMKMFSLKFKNFHWRDNFRRYVILVAAVLFVLFNGVEGLAWTIVLYILISAVTNRVNPETF